MNTTLSFAGQSNKWNTAEDAANVVDAIEKHPCLHCLDLENNTLGPDAARVIGDALAKHPEFQRAHFKDLFTGRLKTEIPLALKHLFSGINRAKANLLELDLSDNALGPVGVEGMVDFMCSPACYSLQELRLNNNGLGITGGTMLAKSLEKLLDNSERDGHPWKLKVFIAGRNRLEKVGARIYAPIFKRLGSLEELAMPQNGIFHEGIAALAEALSHNKGLRILNLNDNTFTKKGAIAMADHLPAMQSLEVINFGDCLLKTAGAIALALALMPGHQNLEELYLDGNELTAEGGLSVVEAIQNKPKLSKLMLDDNMFGAEGVEMMETFLKDVGKQDALVPMENNIDPDSDDEDSNSDTSSSSSSSDDDDEEEEDERDVTRDNRTVEAEEDDEVEVISMTRSPASQEVAQIDANASFISGPLKPEQCTAAQFVQAPSAERLIGLPPQEASSSALAAAATRNYATPDQEISDVLRLLVTTAGLAHTDDQTLQAAVKATVVGLGQKVFDTAKEHLLVSFTTNTLLVHLGLIKCEDKRFSPCRDARAALYSLNNLVTQDYFPKDAKNTLQYFVSSPNPRLDAHPQEKNQLLTALSR